MRALAAATRYGQWRAKDHGTPVAPAGINRRIAEDVVHTVLSVDPKGRRLTHDEAAALLAAYGIDVWGKEEAHSADDAVAAAKRVGYPVVLKSTAPMLRHQGGVGGVRVDLRTELSSAGRLGVAHRAPGPARRRPAGRAEDGDARGALRDHLRRGPPVRPGDRLQRGRDADRAARRHRLPHPSAHRRHGLRADLLGQGGTGAARPPRCHAGAPGGPGRPHRSRVGARRRPRRGRVAWCSTRSTPTPAAWRCSGPRSCSHPHLAGPTPAGAPSPRAVALSRSRRAAYDPVEPYRNPIRPP